ncbi:MAG: hypothetical protein JSW06_07195 [Thermoplasmatales archaeon]|nr:MAG: hypothetical protein JSW06_07195 [Thermoplasmatales archaeon]
MNKKILLGSIIAVTILIGVSFTSVIGYDSVKSSSALNSPLFNVRTSRALDKESKDISTDYLGHGEETNIQLKGRIQRAEQVQKVVDIISKMDDRALIKYFGRIINQKQMTDEETSDLLQALHYIIENSNDMKYYDTENSPTPTLGYITCLGTPCLIQAIVLIFVEFFLSILVSITEKYTCINTVGACCQTFTCAI